MPKSNRRPFLESKTQCILMGFRCFSLLSKLGFKLPIQPFEYKSHFLFTQFAVRE